MEYTRRNLPASLVNKPYLTHQAGWHRRCAVMQSSARGIARCGARNLRALDDGKFPDLCAANVFADPRHAADSVAEARLHREKPRAGHPCDARGELRDRARRFGRTCGVFLRCDRRHTNESRFSQWLAKTAEIMVGAPAMHPRAVPAGCASSFSETRSAGTVFAR